MEMLRHCLLVWCVLLFYKLSLYRRKCLNFGPWRFNPISWRIRKAAHTGWSPAFNFFSTFSWSSSRHFFKNNTRNWCWQPGIQAACEQHWELINLCWDTRAWSSKWAERRSSCTRSWVKWTLFTDCWLLQCYSLEYFSDLERLQLLYFVSVDNTRKEIIWSTYPVVFSNHCLMDWPMFRIWMLSRITQSIEKLMQKQVGHWQNVKFWDSHLPTSASECIYKGAVPEQWHRVVIFISMSDGTKKKYL